VPRPSAHDPRRTQEFLGEVQLTMADPQPRPEHPRPQLFRESWLNLNGVWEFEADPGRSGRERGLASAPRLSGEILVPFCPESRLSGIGNTDFLPAVWYQRTVSIPNEWAGSRVLLHIGAVDYESEAFVNGRSAGTHRGGTTPVELEVTDLLQPGENSVTICAEDDTRSPLQPTGKQSPRYESFQCFYTRTTGIWQTVWLEAVPRTYITKAKLTPDLESGRVLVEVGIDGPELGVSLEAVALASGEVVGQATGRRSGNRAVAVVELSATRAWSPEDPFLYDLGLRLVRGGAIVDEVTSYFGLRTVRIDGLAITLNGKRLFQRLVLDQGFYPDGIYTAPSDEDLRRDVELGQAMGFNGARLHQKVFEPRFLYWADRLGYLLWGEFPSWGLDLARGEALDRFLREWVGVLDRDVSHPSIVGWCPFNETNNRQNPEVLRAVYRATKALDPTRPVIDTSGYVHVETDIYDVHDYDQNPATFAARYQPLAEGGEARRNFPRDDAPYRPGQPYFVSEYGGIWWNPGQRDEVGWGYGDRPRSEAEFLDRYRRLTEYLLRHPKMCAFCYTQLTDVEHEVNGLYTYHRQPKFDPSVIRSINSQPAAIEESVAIEQAT
jgi:beta-galactosidase/beta-glucuronidase